VSEIFKFTLVAQGKAQAMVLEIDGTQFARTRGGDHGQDGTRGGADREWAVGAEYFTDGTFRHFTEQLDPGQHTISIIGSNRRGGTAMKQVSIVVPK